MEIKDRVAFGASWLDERYPDWYKTIDLGTLNLARCHLCVLGQVFTGCIPAEEQGQLIAQVAEKIYGSWEEQVIGYSESYRRGILGGYNVLSDYYELPAEGAHHGFLAYADIEGYPGDPDQEYVLLLNEWTRVILQRRLDDHPEVGRSIDYFLADLSQGVEIKRTKVEVAA